MDECRVCANADNEYCFACDNGNHFKPMTNADRIRQMTDEELAEWVTLMVCKYRSCGNCPMADWCTPDRGITDWLKSPADKEGGG